MSSEYQELLEKLLNSDTTDVIPQSRAEHIMLTVINSLDIDTLPEPGSRMEAYLMALITKMGEGGSASQPTVDSLIVTHNPDNFTKATHSSSEIYKASQSGKTVQFYDNPLSFRLAASNPDSAFFTFGGISELKTVSFMTIRIDDRSEIMTLGPAYVPTTPDTMEVGQTIVVKSVDEAGHPTEWEAVSIPTVDDILAALPAWEGGSY